jgi:hypothetical protein
LSLIIKLPVSAPVEEGENVTLRKQLAFGARLVPQPLPSKKSPLMLMPEIASEAVPVFVRVIVSGVLTVPSFCDPNAFFNATGRIGYCCRITIKSGFSEPIDVHRKCSATARHICAKTSDYV